MTIKTIFFYKPEFRKISKKLARKAASRGTKEGR